MIVDCEHCVKHINALCVQDASKEETDSIKGK
jgi:hypothetical protein